ncbi:MAG: hypothetical protein KC609_24840 [Myxococcales bacterium]|nr:hypothetical protein [Myxococcales bacterium]
MKAVSSETTLTVVAGVRGPKVVEALGDRWFVPTYALVLLGIFWWPAFALAALAALGWLGYHRAPTPGFRVELDAASGTARFMARRSEQNREIALRDLRRASARPSEAAPGSWSVIVSGTERDIELEDGVTSQPQAVAVAKELNELLRRYRLVSLARALDAPASGDDESESIRCPYCRAPVSDATQLDVCVECGTPHHRDCRKEHAGCAVFGCTSKRFTKYTLEELSAAIESPWSR